MDLLPIGTRVHVEHHLEEFDGVIVGHGFIHREHVRWSSNNFVYPVLLIEVRIGTEADLNSVRVIAPDAVEITVLNDPNDGGN